MRQRTRYKSARLNFWVVLLCLSVCAGSVWIFFKDLNSSSSRTDKEKIATVTFKYRVSQRKFNDRAVWERLQQNSSLYDGDTIHTSEMSLTTILFDEGTSIDISENSMVQISKSEKGNLRLSISGGQIDVNASNSSGEIELEASNGTIIKLESGGQLSAKLDSENGLGLNIKEGNANIRDRYTGENESLAAGESVKIDNNGVVKKAPITVTSVSENQRVLLFSENEENSKIPIEWFPLKEEKNVVVQTSEKKDFSTIKETFKVKDISKVEINSEDNPIYWRAFTEDDYENFVSGKLSFEKVPPVVATSPLDGTNYSYFKEKPKVQFAWRGNSFASKYKIEIGKSPALENPEFVREVTTQIFTVTNLDEGKYFWRITPYYETNKIGWYGETETMSFGIEKKDAPSAPAASYPIENKTFTFSGDSEDSTIEADFSWKGENINSTYLLQVADDEIFSNIIFEKGTKSKSVHEKFVPSQLPAGDYYWKVSQKTDEDEILVSDTRKFTVAKYVPEENKLLYPEDGYSIEKENLSALNFMWKISKENEASFKDEATKLQISTSKNFSNPIFEKDVQEASLNDVDLKTGEYYWRVVKGDSTTEPRQISILGKLESPKVMLPKNEATLLFSRNTLSSTENNGSKDIYFSWEKIGDADFYKIKITDDETKKVVKELSEIKSDHLSIPFSAFVSSENISDLNLAKLKKFNIEVQAFTNETKFSATRKSEISNSQFSLKVASPVKLISPANKNQIGGLSALKNGVTLRWTKGEDPYSTAALNLWKVEASGKMRLVTSFKNPKETVSIPRLTDGTYRWTVKATSKDGYPLDAEETNEFTITKVPELERPILSEPERNQKIDSMYLRKNRMVTFTWKPVEGATDYNFTLYQKMPNGSLKKIYSLENQKTTQVRFRDLKSLDIGNFQWQVTATNRAKDGFVYQKGKTASGEFKIDFSLPGKLETIEPGVMYGE